MGYSGFSLKINRRKRINQTSQTPRVEKYEGGYMANLYMVVSAVTRSRVGYLEKDGGRR